jgi:hypothetical protein
MAVDTLVTVNFNFDGRDESTFIDDASETTLQMGHYAAAF